MGMHLRQVGGRMVVRKLAPGGAAECCGEIQPDDVVLAVAPPHTHLLRRPRPCSPVLRNDPRHVTAGPYSRAGAPVAAGAIRRTSAGSGRWVKGKRSAHCGMARGVRSVHCGMPAPPAPPHEAQCEETPARPNRRPGAGPPCRLFLRTRDSDVRRRWRCELAGAG